MELCTTETRAQERTSGYKIFVCIIFSILIHFPLLIQEGALNSFQIRLHFRLNLKVIWSFFSFSIAAQNVRYKIINEKYCTAVSQLCSATKCFRASQLMQLSKKRKVIFHGLFSTFPSFYPLRFISVTCPFTKQFPMFRPRYGLVSLCTLWT
jgi:hypothetical protein